MPLRPKPSETIASSVFMLQASRATHKRVALPSQQSVPSHPVVPDSTMLNSTTPQGPPHFAGVSPNIFPLRSVAPTLKHSGVSPLGHYPFGQILFLFPPPKVYSIPFMATLSSPHITLWMPI